MAVLNRAEMLVSFLAGIALGILCTLDSKKIQAQQKPQKEPSLVAERFYFKGNWELWYHPGGKKEPLSRETRYYVSNVLENKVRLLWEEFERDWLFEQFGENGKPKQVQAKIWCFTQALHAAVRAYPGAPPGFSRFPELKEELANRQRPARGGNEYYLDSVFYAPGDVGTFAKRGDQIYVVEVDSDGDFFGLSNRFWVNARTGEVAALFPEPKPGVLAAGTRVLLERPKN